MKAVFISDAHIRGHDDPNLPALIAFLEWIAGQVERVVIVGDLFHTWFGFQRVVFDEYVPLLGTLHAVRRAGTEIVYIAGNHDYEPGRYLETILGAEVYDTEMVVCEDGLRAYVAHGDLVDVANRKYRLLRRILRNPAALWLARCLPPSWIWRIGQWMSVRYSGEHSGEHHALTGVFRRYAHEKLQEGYGAVILAHLHVPAFERMGEGPHETTYVNLGDWLHWRTFLRWDGGRLSLRQWEWPGGREREWRVVNSE